MNLLKPFCLLAISMVVSCAPDSSPPPNEAQGPSGPQEAVVTASVAPDDFEHPTIVGMTNLPTGAQLIVTLSRSQTAFSAQDNVSVRNGQYRAGPFTNRGESLIPGEYEIRVTAPLADIQPEEVRSLVGQDYANYTGPLIDRSGIGTTLSFTTTFTIPGAISPEAVAAERQQSQQEFRLWAERSCEGISQRATERARKVAECVAGATQNLP